MVLFAALAVAAFVSSKKGNNEGGDEEEPALIAVDGDFADWDAIKDVTTIECPEDAFFPALKKAKLAADAKNIYAYIEYEPVEGQAVAPFEMIINADNDDETGGALTVRMALSVMERLSICPPRMWSSRTVAVIPTALSMSSRAPMDWKPGRTNLQRVIHSLTTAAIFSTLHVELSTVPVSSRVALQRLRFPCPAKIWKSPAAPSRSVL